MKRISLICACFFLYTAALRAADEQLVNAIFDTSAYTAAEYASLIAEDIVIRSTDKEQRVSLNPVHPLAQKLRDDFNELDPAYSAEVIQVLLAKDSDELAAVLRTALENITQYTNIPYYSVQNDTWNKLYDAASVISITMHAQDKLIVASFSMPPFDEIEMHITTSIHNGELCYEAVNTTPVKWHGITCIKPYRMKTEVAVFSSPDGTHTVLYGWGGVDVPPLFFMRKRIETAFINRIKSFCAYVFSAIRVQ